MGDTFTFSEEPCYTTAALRKTPFCLIITAVSLTLLVACTKTAAFDEQVSRPLTPALRPASTLLNGAVTPQPASPEAGFEDGISGYRPTAVPTATEIPRPGSRATPLPSVMPSGVESQQAVQTPGEDGPPNGISADPAESIASGNTYPSDDLPKRVPGANGSVDCQAEIADYQEHLVSDPTLASYEAPLIADCYLDEGDRPSAIAVLEKAFERDLDRLTEVQLRENLASLYVEDGLYPEALAQYEAILSVSQTEITRGRAMYRAGQAAILAGNKEAGLGRYLSLVNDHPAHADSYRALSALIEAGVPVDEYQRGLVEFQAGAYEQATMTFGQYIESNPEYRLDAHLYLAWSLEEQGLLEDALAAVDSYLTGATGDPSLTARGWLERAEMQVRAGGLRGAYDDYQNYLARFPGGEEAARAAWHVAELAETMGLTTTAVDHYQDFAQAYPNNNRADEALFRAGYLSWQLDRVEQALALWRQAVDTYSQREYGAASLLQLLKRSNADDTRSLVQLVDNITGHGYYATRVRHLVSGVEPFAPAGVVDLNKGELGRDYAESWLRELLGLDPGYDVATLSPELARDARMIRGQKLWQLGLESQAENEFASLQADFAQDALASYQLALTFRDLGLYRLSILAATSIMSTAGVGVSGAPRFIGRLAYPAYYAEIISVEVTAYGYDPLLHLALIREESYFDKSATSPAGALGLGQVVPETGQFVARRLNWPEYTSFDLYRPDINIAVTAYFLDQQLQAYGHNVGAALSSYNAGPGHANRWYAVESEDFDIYLETVDFPETRRFIKQIYITQAVYRFLYS